MSSFVINKCEYMKVAGLFAALAECEDYYREPVFRVWNNRENRVYNAEDIRRDFVRLYNINAAAVAKQYGDEVVASDGAEYMHQFNKVRADITMMWRYKDAKRKQLKITFYGVIRFFCSVSYQIEDDENTRRSLMIMNKYYRNLYKALRIADGICDDDLSDYWGAFDISD